MDTLESLVCTILEIDPDTRGEIGRATHGEWTSVKQVQIMIALEDLFRIEFTGEEMAGGISVSDLRRMLANKGVSV